MQAIILAAGMGKRLKELTQHATKCMVEVNGVSMINRVMNQLDKLNLSRIVLVVGYEAEKLKDYVNGLGISTPIEYVTNEIYNQTNNIYSLYLAKEYLLQEDTLLLESDLIFEDAVLGKIVNHPYPSLVLVAKFESWMDGTVVTLNEDDFIEHFYSKKEFDFDNISKYYKTVNIYKFSKDFSQTHYVPFLEAYCKALGHNEYYEQVLKVITLLDNPDIKAVRLDNERWYEIDDVQDLDIAESIFSKGNEHLSKIQKRYGGYWRYPGLIDFCYLVNPYYPDKKLLHEMKANFDRLICDYPSGLAVNDLLAAKYWGLHQNQVCVGNGAAELIKSLMTILKGKIGVIRPTFEEYPNRCKGSDVISYIPDNRNFAYSAKDLMDFFNDKPISTLLLINPDNPSGNYIKKQDILELVKWAQAKNIRIIIDESFVDFVDAEENATLLAMDILTAYNNLIVVKSISKSFGVPGIRLGIAASNDLELIHEIQQDMPIWNINSFAEFYLQIFEKYRSSYDNALKKFKKVRTRYADNLSKLPMLRIIPSQANYITCEVVGDKNSTDITEKLLNDYNIFIKDLSSKKGFEGKSYIRLAVKTEEENNLLINALKNIYI